MLPSINFTGISLGLKVKLNDGKLLAPCNFVTFAHFNKLKCLHSLMFSKTYDLV